jgi:hypothetical protein
MFLLYDKTLGCVLKLKKKKKTEMLVEVHKSVGLESLDL